MAGIEGRLFNYLSLLSLGGLGRAGLETYFGSSGEAWLDQDLAVLVGRIKGSLVPDEVGLAEAQDKAAQQMRAIHALALNCRFREQAGYPQGLLRLKRPPRLVFMRGPLRRVPAVAVVGTREPSARGLAEARSCSVVLARAGLAVLNGLARGIDRAALETALEAQAVCVGVLAAGHSQGEGARGLELERRVLREGGCLVSEYGPGVAAHKGSFIERDRIQAGLSAAVLVVESDLGGGTLHTASAAREAGIPVFALLSAEDQSRAGKDASKLMRQRRGNWSLIRAKAAVPVRSAAAFAEIARDMVQKI